MALLTGIARKLASSGYGVFAMDYPGFGLSEGLHGYVPSFDKLVDDVIEHYSKVKGKLYYFMSFLLNLFVAMPFLFLFFYLGEKGMNRFYYVESWLISLSTQ
jgi:hypothetical protein